MGNAVIHPNLKSYLVYLRLKVCRLGNSRLNFSSGMTPSLTMHTSVKNISENNGKQNPDLTRKNNLNIYI